MKTKYIAFIMMAIGLVLVGQVPALIYDHFYYTSVALCLGMVLYTVGMIGYSQTLRSG